MNQVERLRFLVPRSPEWISALTSLIEWPRSERSLLNVYAVGVTVDQTRGKS